MYVYSLQLLDTKLHTSDRKDGIEAGGRGSSDIVVASGLGCRNVVDGTGWAISLVLCTNGLRKESSGHTGFPFLAAKLFSQSLQAFTIT